MVEHVRAERLWDQSPPVSRTNYVMERLKEDMANGVIEPGELIKQTVLARRYGVSPTPVREALRILQSDGLINYSPHKGASVRELDPAAARDLYRLRAGAEREATEMAVERMTPEGLRLIEQCYDRLTELMSSTESTSADLSVSNKAFHFAIYGQSSPLVVQYLELLWSRFTPTSTVFTNRSVAMKLHEEHGAILEAVRDGDARTAGERTAAHILSASCLREGLPDVRAVGADEDQAKSV